ncbi:type II toxin-antitoxin system RelE family toxin [Geomonas sp. Red276]
MSGPKIPFTVSYHPDVKARDIPNINVDMRTRIRKAIETRLMIAPHEYGEPLRKSLKGYWKMRVGDYRVVFKILEEQILVLAICHRKDVYSSTEKRIHS